MQRKKPGTPRPWLTRFLEVAGIVMAAVLIVFFIAVLYFAKTLPSIEEISNQQISQSTKLYDRTGTVLLYEINGGGERRTVVAFNAIPQSLKDATLAI